jgi:hypothetical protein
MPVEDIDPYALPAHAGFVRPTQEPTASKRGDRESPFIPLAEMAFDPSQVQTVSHETIWANETDRDITLQLHIGTNPVFSERARAIWLSGSPNEMRERRKGLRYYTIKAKTQAAIPNEFDNAIQATRCVDPDCGKGVYCRNRSHNRIIVGGLCPQGLRNCGWQHRPTLLPALDTARQTKDEAMRATADAIAAKNNAEAQLALANDMTAKARDEARELAERAARAEQELARTRAMLGAQTVAAVAATPQRNDSPPAKEQAPQSKGK